MEELEVLDRTGDVRHTKAHWRYQGLSLDIDLLLSPHMRVVLLGVFMRGTHFGNGAGSKPAADVRNISTSSVPGA